MVSKIISKSVLKLSYLTGVNEAGNDVVKAQRFNNINLKSTSQNLYEVANGIATLVKYPKTAIELEDDSILVSEA